MRHKTRTWTRSPKGVPAVMGKTQGERAQLIRYYVAKDNKSFFAKTILHVSPSIWSMIETGKRRIGEDMKELIIAKVKGVTRDYIAEGDYSAVGDRFMSIIREAQAKASGLSQ